MKKFEYSEIQKDELISVKELNKKGKQGWELCSLIWCDHPVQLGKLFTYIFKREIQ